MRYIANDYGYLLQVSFGAMIECNGRGCTEYTGDVPDGYYDLADWFALEGEKLHRWYIEDGQLTLDDFAPAPEVYVPPTPPEPEPTISMALLWENESPTSAFSAKTIALDLSKYDFIEVYFAKANNDARNWICYRMPIGYDGDPFHMSHIQNTSRASVISSRHTSVTTTGVEFGAGFYKYTSSNTGATENESMIPCRIYGIKGVIGQASTPDDGPENYDDITVIDGVMTIYGLENNPTQNGNVLTIK